MFWRTASGFLLTSYPATIARPDVGLSSPQSIRIVVDLPAPFGPINPKTSPLRTSRLIRSTATKSPNLLTRFSTSTEKGSTELGSTALAISGMMLRSRAHRIDKQILNRRLDFENRIEGNAGAPEPCLELRNASRRIVHHNMHSVAGQHEAGDSLRVFQFVAYSPRLRRRDRQNVFAHLRFQIDRRVAEEQLALMHQRDAMAALGRSEEHTS